MNEGQWQVFCELKTRSWRKDGKWLGAEFWTTVRLKPVRFWDLNDVLTLKTPSHVVNNNERLIASLLNYQVL